MVGGALGASGQRSSLASFALEFKADGMAFDAGDRSSMFADLECKTVAEIDSPVAVIVDKAMRERCAKQVDPERRPVLRSDGRKTWLEFDGNQFLEVESDKLAATESGAVVCMGYSLEAPSLGSVVLHGDSFLTRVSLNEPMRHGIELVTLDGRLERGNSAASCVVIAGTPVCRVDMDDRARVTTRINGVAEIQFVSGETWGNDGFRLFPGTAAKFYGMVFVPAAIDDEKVRKLEATMQRRMA